MPVRDPRPVPPEKEDPVAIVGAGLVGSLLAILLADRGHRPAVYERRPDLRQGPTEAGRSINLVLTRRGIRALATVGLAERALALSVPVSGRMIHAASGDVTFQPYGRDESESNHSISRAALNELLVDEAAARGVRFCFRHRLVDADLAAGALFFEDDAGAGRETVRAAIVFGADGAGSALRAALGRQAGFRESVELLEHGYKELEIPPAADGGFRLAPHALHLWPRGDLMLMALPNPAGDFTVTLYLPFRGRRGFEALTTPAEVGRFFAEHFRDAVALIPDLERSFLARPTGSLGTVRCWPWRQEGRALLLGDAAHAIVPFFGQGMNCGFEDCTVLGELLDAGPRGNWNDVCAEFERRRKPDTDAIAAMALENFVEMRDRVGDTAFLLRKQVEHRLETEMPREYRSRYSMVMYSHIPYATAQEAGRLQESILDELCAGLDRAEALDLERARALVRERLAPFLRQRGVALDY